MRFKHILMLFSSILFVLMCFVVLNISSDMTGYERYEIDLTSTLTSDTLIISTKQGVETPSKYMEDGELALIVNQPNQSYDEIILTVYYSNITYDTKKLEEVLGNNVSKFENYLNSFKNGPWDGKLYFSLTQYTDDVKNDVYTVVINEQQITQKVANSENTKMGHSDTFVINPNETGSFDIILGSRFGGAIKSGTYYLKLTLVIEGLHNESNEEKLALSFIDEIKIFFNATINSFKKAGISGLFKFPGVGRFYLTMLLVGLVFYFWKDAKSAYLIGRKIENYGFFEGLRTIKTTLIYGQYACSEEFYGFYRPLWLILGTLVSYIVLLITLPIRVIILIVRDIIGIITPRDDVDIIPMSGNFIGSIAIYLIVLGFVIVFNSVFWIGLILIVGGGALTLLGHKLSKDMYCLWDY